MDLSTTRGRSLEERPQIPASGALNRAQTIRSWGAPSNVMLLVRNWWSQSMFPGQEVPEFPGQLRFWAAFFVLACIAGGLLFPNLSYPLLEPDEGRYAEIGREMLTSGDWIVPTLNHDPYYDKPPMLYWMVAGTLRVLGRQARVARLVPTVASFLIVLTTFLCGSRIVGTRPAFLAALLLTQMAGFVQFGRILILDNVLTLFVSLALFTAYLALRGGQISWRWWLLSSACCGLGALTKGPIALVLALPPIVAYIWLNREAARPALKHWFGYFMLMACLVAPWYVTIIARDAHFAYEFFINQNINRFLGKEYHDNPFWYYIPVVLVGGLPASLLLFPCARYLLSRSPAVRALRHQSLGFFLLWFGWSLVFLSMSHGKLPTYILPATPALAIVLGCCLDAILFRSGAAGFLQWCREKTPGHVLAILTAAWLIGNVVGWRLGLVEEPRIPFLFIEAALILVCIVGGVRWGGRWDFRVGWIACFALGFVVILEMANGFVPEWSRDRSPMSRSEAIADQLRDGKTAVVCYGEEWGSIPFYVDDDSLFLNSKKHSTPEMQQFLAAHQRNLLFMKESDIETAKQVVPVSMEATKLTDSGRARVFLVKRVADTTAN